MHIKGIVLGRELSKIENLDMLFSNTELPVFTTTEGCTTKELYELMWHFGFKRKELLVITTSKHEAFAASQAFCRQYLLEDIDNLNLDTIDEIIYSTKHGI